MFIVGKLLQRLFPKGKGRENAASKHRGCLCSGGDRRAAGGGQLAWESRSVSPETFRPGSDGYKWMEKKTNLLLLLKLIEK